MQFNGSINSQAVESSLNLLLEALGNLSPSMGLIAEDFRQMVADQFASGGTAGGTPWAALAPSTLKRNDGGAILQNTGALLESLTDQGSADHVEMIEKQSLSIGTDLPYAMFHQTGAGWGFGQPSLPPAPRHGHGVPMRPLLVLTAGRQDRWVGFVAQQLQSSRLALGARELGSEL